MVKKIDKGVEKPCYICAIYLASLITDDGIPVCSVCDEQHLHPPLEKEKSIWDEDTQPGLSIKPKLTAEASSAKESS